MAVRYIVVKDHAGQRLDNFLMRELRPVPKSRIMQMIRRGEVRVNAKRARVSLRLEEGDRLRIPPVTIEEKPEKTIPSWLSNLVQSSILHEDERLIVINKPSGIAVHAGGSVKVGLIDVVRSLYDDERIDLAHRIDRDTSGCVLLARTRVAMLEIHHAFQQRQIQKNYDAIVNGVWPSELSIIDQPLTRYLLPNGERRVKIDRAGQPSTTEFVLSDLRANASWMHIKPLTGRTHQIRVHAASAGHFVLGDSKYSQPTPLPRAPRLMLHASKISIGTKLTFSAPLDKPFREYWERLSLED